MKSLCQNHIILKVVAYTARVFVIRSDPFRVVSFLRGIKEILQTKNLQYQYYIFSDCHSASTVAFFVCVFVCVCVCVCVFLKRALRNSKTKGLVCLV